MVIFSFWLILHGAITASLINSFSSMGLDEGKIETISFGRSKLNYFYDDNLIVCIETTDKIKEWVMRKVAKRSLSITEQNFSHDILV
ncbi:MAG: hypothetical protein ACW981_09435 [Candidatus Hodarchaeales archaeon]